MVTASTKTAIAAIPIKIAQALRRRSSMMARIMRRDFDEYLSARPRRLEDRGVLLERSMHSAQQPSYAQGYGNGRIGLGLNGIL
jgi:hypothetical protein